MATGRESEYLLRLKTQAKKLGLETKKIHGGTFQKGLPDLILWGRDLARWIELKAFDVDKYWHPGSLIPLMHGLTQEQWVTLHGLAASNPKPCSVAALVAVEIVSRDRTGISIITLPGADGFHRKDFRLAWDTLLKIPLGTGLVDPKIGVAVCRYKLTELPLWPFASAWWTRLTDFEGVTLCDLRKKGVIALAYSRDTPQGA